MDPISFGITGGDNRYAILKELLENDGHKVSAYCCKHIDNCVESIDKLFANSDVIVGPTPCVRGGSALALNDCREIGLETFFGAMKKHSIKIFFCGMANQYLKDTAEKYGITVYDFFALDEVAIKNAVPTAEGVIQTAMQESDKTIFGSKAIILGYGRCGKILANMLKGIGADVSIACRKSADKAFAYSYGLKCIDIKNIKNVIANYDLIFNTIPVKIIDKEILDATDKNTIIIDIASAPGGIDFNYAIERGIKALSCPGLPGRVAPRTAALILKEALLSHTLSHIST